MKRKMIALLVGALMALSASSAFAAFTNGDLIQVIYDASGTTTFEMGTDLGSLSSLQAAAANSQVGGFGNLLPTAAGVNLQVAYFEVGTTATNGLAFGVTGDPSAPGIVGNKWSGSGNAGNLGNIIRTSGYSNAANTMITSNGATATVIDKNASTYSYFKNGNAVGGFASAATAPYTLSSLATAGQQTDIYQFASANSGSSTKTLLFSLTTNVDGSVVVNPATATPIPAAIYLMGSGLLGMVGLRRKQRG